LNSREKKAQIRTVLRSTPITSILALCETKLPDTSDGISSSSRGGSLVRLPKFSQYDGHYTNDTARSSGCVVYVHNQLPNRHLADKTYKKHKCMLSFVDVSLSSTMRVCIGVVYIHPNAVVDVVRDILNRIKDVLQLVGDGSPVLLLGDFNLRHPSFGIPCKETSKAKALIDFCDDNNLMILNQRDTLGIPTHQGGS